MGVLNVALVVDCFAAGGVDFVLEVGALFGYGGEFLLRGMLEGGSEELVE